MSDLKPDSRLLDALGASQEAPKPSTPIRPIDYLLNPPKRQKLPTRNRPLAYPCPKCHSTNTVAHPSCVEGKMCCRRCSWHFNVTPDTPMLDGPSRLYSAGWNTSRNRRRPKRSSYPHVDRPSTSAAAATAEPNLSQQGVDATALRAEAAAKLGALNK